MIKGMVTIDRRTLEQLSHYGILEPYTGLSIKGTLTTRVESVDERLRLLAYADLITGTKLPRFSEARRQAATKVLATDNYRSPTRVRGQKRRSTQSTRKPVLTHERNA
jgi:hypothetical protein